jgi:glycosyltransferase involved in cell wall biosynthesis
MMEQSKISIIVPVYKVEDYLNACLDSITAQTYQNLEIILVDDGSPDGCGAICDAYGAKDSRIRVIHQPNGGVAAARNAGLAAATGDWIGWVDADDWIEKDMFAFMLSNALAEQADVCVCGRYEELPGGTGSFGFPKRRLLDRRAALKALLENRELDDALYDKLWKRQLFQNIRFPEGRTYEDLATVYRLLEKARRILCLPEQKYHYRRRSGSIVGDTSLPNRMNHYLAAQARYEDMVRRFPEFEALLEERCIAAAAGIWCGWCRNAPAVRRQYAPQLKEITTYARSRLQKVLRCTGSGLAGRLVMRLLPYDSWWAFALAGLIGHLYQRKHGRML